MPFPLVFALAPALITWGARSLAVYGLAKLFSDESIDDLVQIVKSWVVEQAAHYAGLQLDPDAPWSDASLAGAVGQKLGIGLRSLRDKDMIVQDLDVFVVDQISSRSGYVVRSVFDVQILREDLLRIGAAEMTARLGLPAGVMPGPGAVFDPVEVKAQLLTWAKAELMAQVGEGVQIAANDLLSSTDLPGVAAEINSRLASMGSAENVTARQIAVRIANEMATAAIVDYQRLAIKNTKRSRRQASLRAAQEKFRRTHGNRQIYVPLGMVVNVN